MTNVFEAIEITERAAKVLTAAKDTVADTVSSYEDDLKAIRDMLLARRDVTGRDYAETIGVILNTMDDWRQASQCYVDAVRVESRLRADEGR